MKISDILKLEYIKIPLQSRTKEDAIRELMSALKDSQVIKNVNSVQTAVFEREKIMSTGVGNGVAIPHCKHRDCSDFALALGIQPSGIDFDSIDSKPAQIIFLLVGPEDDPGMHIRLLSRISRIISREDVRQEVLRCETPAQLYELISEEEKKLFG